MTSPKRSRFSAVGSTLDLPELEHGVLDLWQREDAFGALRRKNAGGPVFSFIDGPITANIAAMGVHHAWGRTYKDVFQRYKAMNGFDQRYQNGFDCQGLWVEVEVERELHLNNKRDIEAYGLDRFADACLKRVRWSADAITKQSARLGMWMDWEHSYYTHTDQNIAHIWAVLKLAHEKGWLYKGHRSMPWCARCGTALSQHEMIDSYREMTHTSVHVKLPLVDRPAEALVVWTTTPWTLAANVAAAVHPELDYVRVRAGDEVLVLGRKVFETGGLLAGATVLGAVKGRELVGLRYRGPFDELPATAKAAAAHRVIAWEEVGEEEGTGIVHIAPGCGEADFQLSKTEGLEVLIPIDDSARYVGGYGWLEGREAREVAGSVVADLETKGVLLRSAPYTHRYPECWRCHEEIVFRVDDEWFLSMDEIRPKLKEAAAAVRWIPESAGKRMQDWLLNMGDWNISRKRYWGLPLPFYTCAGGHFFVLGSEEELRARALRGLERLRELHRPWIDEVVVACPTCSAESTRVKEVGDCWLDAGIVPFSTLDWMHDKADWQKWFPADFITEMREQIRLWFYSQLFFSVVLTGRAPYESVLAYEKLLDQSGRAMHRSWGNVIVFPEAAEKVGADAMRWLYGRQNVQENILFGYGPLDAVKRRLLTLWNTYSFFVTYAALDRFDPNEAAPPREARSLLDRWILSRLHGLVRAVTADLEAYEPQGPVLAMERFWEELSDWYVRRSRRRFWKSTADDDKRSAEHTLYEVLTTLVRLFAPYMPFLAESMYQNLERNAGRRNAPHSVHHVPWPVADAAAIDDRLERGMRVAMRVVDRGRAARAASRVKTRTPMALLVAAIADEGDRAQLAGSQELLSIIADELNVKRVEVRASAAGLATRRVKPDLKVLGPKLGADLPRAREALASEARFLSDGSVEAGGFHFAANEVLVDELPAEGYAVASDPGVTVAIATALTAELEAEGLARELAHRVNVLRKESGLAIEDRIAFRYDGAISPTVERFRDMLAGEMLATSISEGLRGAGASWSGELNGVGARLEIEKAPD